VKLLNVSGSCNCRVVASQVMRVKLPYTHGSLGVGPLVSQLQRRNHRPALSPISFPMVGEFYRPRRKFPRRHNVAIGRDTGINAAVLTAVGAE